VKRNRIKRLLRESFRRDAKGFSGGIDAVILPTKEAGIVGYHDIKREMDKFFSFLQSKSLLEQKPACIR